MEEGGRGHMEEGGRSHMEEGGRKRSCGRREEERERGVSMGWEERGHEVVIVERRRERSALTCGNHSPEVLCHCGVDHLIRADQSEEILAC